VFNVFNPPALRDNLRESAVEYALVAHLLAGLSIDVSDCPGTTSPATFDATRIALMGHSMGATIAPLTLAAEPTYRAAVLSGAGASWIENVIWKQQPLNVQVAFDLLLDYSSIGRVIPEDDPVLSLFQWAEESADPLVYARSLVDEPPAGRAPRQVLMEQGIVDHYILPNIANAISLPLGLDLAGTPLDATSAELQSLGTTPLEAVISYSGRDQVALPVMGNRMVGGAPVTAAVVQHPSGGIEDGHEIVFQTDPPKREYRCFLETWAAGQVPLVPVPGEVDGGCE
jgi:pimeloyl-ACP methyl ester carboxylesterase